MARDKQFNFVVEGVLATPAQLEAVLQELCPYCGSDNTGGAPDPEVDEGIAGAICDPGHSCHTCHNKWTTITIVELTSNPV